MATGSFKHNIIIKDKRDAKALIDALETVVFMCKERTQIKPKKSRRSVTRCEKCHRAIHKKEA